MKPAETHEEAGYRVTDLLLKLDRARSYARNSNQTYVVYLYVVPRTDEYGGYHLAFLRHWMEGECFKDNGCTAVAVVYPDGTVTNFPELATQKLSL